MHPDIKYFLEQNGTILDNANKKNLVLKTDLIPELLEEILINELIAYEDLLLEIGNLFLNIQELIRLTPGNYIIIFKDV